MKRSLIFSVAVLLASSSIALARSARSADDEQETTRRARQVVFPNASFLGVELDEVSHETAQRLRLREERGALVTDVVADSSAAKAGLKKDDVIVKWNGEQVESSIELSRHLRETPAGRMVRLGVIRDGREMDIDVKLGGRTDYLRRFQIERAARPQREVRVRAGDYGYLGIQSQSMSRQLAEYFGLSNRMGALVVFVYTDSPAAKAGIRAGDVILSVAGENVEDPMGVRRALRSKTEGQVEVRVMRDKQEQTFTVQLEKSGARSWMIMPDDFEIVIPSPRMAIPALPRLAVRVPRVAVTVPRVKTAAIAPMPMVKLHVIKPAKIAPLHIKMPKIAPMPKVKLPKITIPSMRILVPGYRYRIAV